MARGRVTSGRKPRASAPPDIIVVSLGGDRFRLDGATVRGSDFLLTETHDPAPTVSRVRAQALIDKARRGGLIVREDRG